MTQNRVSLSFRATGPAVTGEWAEETTTRRTWRDWVRLYGSDENVVIRLAEETDDQEHVLTAWENGHVCVPTEEHRNENRRYAKIILGANRCTDVPQARGPHLLGPNLQRCRGLGALQLKINRLALMAVPLLPDAGHDLAPPMGLDRGRCLARLRAVILAELQAAGVLEMDDCAIDGSHVRALKGGTDTGPSLVDRGCPGSKSHVIVDQHATPLVRPDHADKIAGVVHVDGTARVQTVDPATTPVYGALIQHFDQLTGVPVVLNTSFNDRESIVETPAHALATLQDCDLDAACFGPYLVERA